MGYTKEELLEKAKDKNFSEQETAFVAWAVRQIKAIERVKKQLFDFRKELDETTVEDFGPNGKHEHFVTDQVRR